MLSEMPIIGLGTYIGVEGKVIRVDKDRLDVVENTVFTALQIGYRHLDLAPAYDNLSAIKNALQRAFSPVDQGGLGLQRGDLWITIKANPTAGVFRVDELLTQLHLEYFDLFLWHLPHVGGFFDSEEILTQAWQSLAEFDPAKLPRIGVSNFYLPHLERLLSVCEKEHLRTPFANQIAYNVAEQPVDLLTFHQQHAIKTMAYSPLGFQFSAMLVDLPSVTTLAQELGVKPAQAQLAWLMAKDITVIPASTSREHLQSNFSATDYIAAVQAVPALSEALDQEVAYAGLFESCMLTVQNAKQHAAVLHWDVSPASGMTPY